MQFLPYVLITLVLLCSVTSGQVVQLDIDATRRFQTWEGFGASGAWWPNYLMEFPAEKRKEMFDLLFGQRGIDLDIYRYNIPAGSGEDVLDPLRRTANIIDEHGKIDVRRDVKGIAMLREAYAAGVRRFVLFSNSPPAHLTSNGKPSGGEGGGSNLQPGKQTEFADYLLEVARQIREIVPQNSIAISPINEPNWKWGEKWRGQEGCHYTPEEARDMVHTLILREKKSGAKFAIESPEVGEWKTAPLYADAMLGDEIIRKNIGAFSIHSYWTDHGHRAQAAEILQRKFPDVKFAMTEVCQMQHGHDLSIDSGIEVAQIVHDDITTGKVVNWQWWLAIYIGGYKDALIYANPKTQKIEPTKRLFAIGQFSRFIKPGFVHVFSTSTKSIQSAAFVSPDGSRLAVVLVNNDKSSHEVKLNAKPYTKLAACCVTDETRDLAEIAPQNGAFSIPARSIFTVVLNRQ